MLRVEIDQDFSTSSKILAEESLLVQVSSPTMAIKRLT